MAKSAQAAAWVQRRGSAPRTLCAAVGFACSYMVENWVSAQGYALAHVASWASFSLFGATALAIMSMLCACARMPGREVLRNIDTVAALLSALAVLCLPAAIDTRGAPLEALACEALAATATCWLIARWALAMARQSLSLTVASVMLGVMGTSAAKITFSFLPGPATAAITCMLPLASVCALRMFEDMADVRAADEPAGASTPTPWFTQDALASLALPGTSVSLFLLLWSMLNMGLKATSGHYGYGEAATPALVTLAQVIDIAFACGLLVWVWRRKGSIVFNTLWRIAFVCLATTVLSVAFLGLTQMAQVFTSAAYEMADAMIWLTLVDVMRHLEPEAGGSGERRKALCCCLGFLVLVRLPDALGRVAVNAYGIDVFDERGLIVIMFAVVMAVAFLLPHRSPGAQLLFMELERGARPEGDVARPGEGETNGASADTLDGRCEALAQSHGLTPREVQIVRLLSRGRSKQYIAETLYLSENTVRTYTRRIYSKLDIHSRQELQDALGVE